MNIKQVSYGLIGGLMMAGTVASCTDDTYKNKAKEQAVHYLDGNELLKAERFARQQSSGDNYNGESIMYWDSLLIEAKSKEAYLKGHQLIQDSINGKFHRKVKYKPTLDTLFTDNVIEKSRNEYANYTSAVDFINARNNAPSDNSYHLYNNLVATTHYWNLITIAGKQNEAYKKGMADARKEFGINKQ